MNGVIALIAILSFAAAEETCPAWQDWGEYSSDCLWYPVANMRRRFIEHCQIPVPPGAPTPAPAAVPLPEGFTPPATPCGNCGFHVRCRKRSGKKDGCFGLEADKKVCTSADHAGASDVCDLPKTVFGDCRWDMFLETHAQCINANPLLPDWRRDGYRNILHNSYPKGHCVEHEGRCRCCCSPFWPSEDGSSCVKKEPENCPAFGPFNAWSSQCLFFPESAISQGIRDHCQLTGAPKIPMPELPEGVTLPDKCGFCSFKVRCKKRDDAEGCFNLKLDKKVCGNDDCPGCGNVCPMSKINGTCNWSLALRNRVLAHLQTLEKAAEAQGKKIPRYKKEGYMKMIGMLPWGKCIEHNNQCMCCCHPFDPHAKADGTFECKPKDQCIGPWLRDAPSK